jgi:predicted helicase
MPKIFPTSAHANLGFYATTVGASMPFTVLATDVIPDQALFGAQTNGQYFPRFVYEADSTGTHLFAGGSVGGYRRLDNVTDAILREYQSAFGTDVSKDDVFYYVYGTLHSPQYRTEFAADLKKMLPRIPMVTGDGAFWTFVQAGRDLADLHWGYETVEPYPLDEQVHTTLDSDADLYRVQKMRFAKSGKTVDKSTVIYNSHITLAGIPDEAHEYMLGSRSALEWVIERYQVKTDKASGIVNDPNDWCDEVDDPRYIIDLVKRIVTVSVETVKIVKSLPSLELDA